jgi:hypothetical protein
MYGLLRHRLINGHGEQEKSEKHPQKHDEFLSILGVLYGAFVTFVSALAAW